MNYSGYFYNIEHQPMSHSREFSEECKRIARRISEPKIEKIDELLTNNKVSEAIDVFARFIHSIPTEDWKSILVGCNSFHIIKDHIKDRFDLEEGRNYKWIYEEDLADFKPEPIEY